MFIQWLHRENTTNQLTFKEIKLCKIIPSWGSAEYYVQWHISVNLMINSYTSVKSNASVLQMDIVKGEDWKQSLHLQEQKLEN